MNVFTGGVGFRCILEEMECKFWMIWQLSSIGTYCFKFVVCSDTFVLLIAYQIVPTLRRHFTVFLAVPS